MKIGIIGATGKAGTDITREAVNRGHEVVALVRSAEKAASLPSTVTVMEKDAFALTANDLRELDVLVNSFGTAPDTAEQHVELTEQLVGILRDLGEEAPRLLVILGAGSLFSGEDRHRFVEDLRQVPEAQAWISIPENQFRQLQFLETVADVNWTGISPQAMFLPGEATTPKLGTDEIMVAADGESHTTTGTMALAVLDEVENPAHEGVRFTVSDA